MNVFKWTSIVLQLIFTGLSFAHADVPLQNMTLDQKIGQLFILGFEGNKMSPRLQKHIRDFKPGGLIYFSKNLKGLDHTEIRDLNLSILKEFKNQKLVDPFLSIDQEGALVARVKTLNKLPNALSIGSTQLPELSFQFGEAIGHLLSSLHFNLNYAPVLDIANPFEKTFIGIRSFGSDPHLVAKHGEQFSRGLLSQGVLPTAKHFPGTGSLKLDPHMNFASILMSFDELKKFSLPPFESFAKIEPSAVMVSHVSFPTIDRTRMPSSFSNTLNHDLIRNKLQYKGLIITDDLMMDGALVGRDMRSRVVKSLYAGSDMIMITWSYSQQLMAKNAIKEALRDGVLDEAFIDEKVARILAVKQQLKVKASKALISSNNYENKILNLNKSILQSQLSSIQSRRPAENKKHNRYLLFTKGLLNNKVVSFASNVELLELPSSASELTSILKSRTDIHHIIIHNESAQNNRWLSEFIQKQPDSVAIINTAYPGIPLTEKPRQIINLYMNSPELGPMLSRLL